MPKRLIWVFRCRRLLSQSLLQLHREGGRESHARVPLLRSRLKIRVASSTGRRSRSANMWRSSTTPQACARTATTRRAAIRWPSGASTRIANSTLVASARPAIFVTTIAEYEKLRMLLKRKTRSVGVATYQWVYLFDRTLDASMAWYQSRLRRFKDPSLQSQSRKRLTKPPQTESVSISACD